jgi:hypothetical protein
MIPAVRAIVPAEVAGPGSTVVEDQYPPVHPFWSGAAFGLPQ